MINFDNETLEKHIEKALDGMYIRGYEWFYDSAYKNENEGEPDPLILFIRDEDDRSRFLDMLCIGLLAEYKFEADTYDGNSHSSVRGGRVYLFYPRYTHDQYEAFMDDGGRKWRALAKKHAPVSYE